MDERKCHIAMYPWFALGHLTPYIHIANMLAKKGHMISFLVPTNTQYKLEPFNHHPNLISFVPITVPHVEGLPLGAETTSDVPSSLHPLIMTAMDKTEKVVERLLQDLMVDVVFFDLAHWIPNVCRRIRVKSVNYCVISPVTVAYVFSPARQTDWSKFHAHEARDFTSRSNMKFGGDITLIERAYIGLSLSDALAYNASRELEGPFSDYLRTQFHKPVLLSGPMVTDLPSTTLTENLSSWLDRYNPGSVIYCAFGSECALTPAQFQELLLGLELTRMPFLAALKSPVGMNSIDDAIPEGLLERLEGRGLVYGGWVQQNLILQHGSVGCFVTHCGWGSLSEALVNKCRLVLLPNGGDQVINSRIMSEVYGVGIEVQKGEEDGVFIKMDVFEAVKKVMDEDGEVGKEVKDKHERIREFLVNKEVKSAYIDSFSHELQDFLESYHED
ncbi:UDP-glucuronosyl/UDP-glucosyltransferase [Cynara cardunculus var. scolymus]|uniref:Glycosyltransferase n=1 Tax=Cynara cardunculus var. scolymus TaxID=59895 RepID=A0A118K553_CYNCS|nr:UDP-glucuronosyl/UDP-glucosyltransferase [Cynara cardunculus var. scolymus]